MISLQSIVLLVVSYFVIPRLTFLPPSLHGLLIVFGPFLLPRLANAFKTARASSRSAVPVRPTPPNVARALNLLFLSIAISIVLTLPHFAPENVFLKTQSRLQIETSTLFHRLGLLRPLTESDELLKAKFGSMHNRLLYLAHGPDSLLNCVWCGTSDGGTNDEVNFTYYGLPKIIMPHALHLAVLGLATSSLVGKEGARFRIHAAMAGLSLLVAELWRVNFGDITVNKNARSLHEVDFIHWRVRVLRFFAFAVVDALLALVLWLTSTNRWMAQPVTVAERLELTTRQVEMTMAKMQALSLLTNSINRDQTLRNFREAYWRHEGVQLDEVMQEEEVMALMNSAVAKMDMQSVNGQIGRAAETVLAGVDSMTSESVALQSAGRRGGEREVPEEEVAKS